MSRCAAPTPAAVILRRARELSGLTQQELADRSGIAAPTISAYETGRRDPSVTNLVRLLDDAGLALALQESVRTHRGRRLDQALSLTDVLPRDGHDDEPLPPTGRSWSVAGPDPGEHLSADLGDKLLAVHERLDQLGVEHADHPSACRVDDLAVAADAGPGGP